jgi:hypothetical protein
METVDNVFQASKSTIQKKTFGNFFVCLPESKYLNKKSLKPFTIQFSIFNLTGINILHFFKPGPGYLTCAHEDRELA